MAQTAESILYREEFIEEFERGYSKLRATTTQESMTGSGSAVFVSAGSNSATAVNRGTNGRIPSRSDDLTQYTATLKEWHDKPILTRWRDFADQTDRRRILQMTSMKVLNRKMDDDIIEQLDTATVQYKATAEKASFEMVTDVWATLGEADVDMEDEDNLFFVITPKFQKYLLQIPEFASADYVDVKPIMGPARSFRRWAGFNWICHTGLTGKGTATEKCYAYHRNGVGNAFSASDLDTDYGYNSEDDYFYARTSGFFGSKKLLNSGIVQVLHDGA